MKKSIVHRFGLAGVALAAALGSSFGLARCGAAAAGPLSDVEQLSREAVLRLGSSALTEEQRVARLDALAPFRAARSEAAALASCRLRGLYEPEGPGFWRRVASTEQALGVRFELLHVFVGWTPRRAGRFPSELAREIWDAGSLALVTWEPWTEAFDEVRPPSAESSLQSITLGRYDAYVDEFARAAAEYGQPLLLRFGHEMNDAYRYPWGPQRGNLPEHYRAAFRHVRERFARLGATKVLWVWSPSSAYDFDAYYPGADVVDWVATGVLNYGTVMRWSAWWSLEQLLAPRYARLAALPHPLMIAELGTVREGGDAAAWYREAASTMAGQLPAVRGLTLFHHAADATLEHRVVDFTATADARLRQAAGDALRDFHARR